jgi:transcriptional regulator with XRE-family HTH domain
MPLSWLDNRSAPTWRRPAGWPQRALQSPRGPTDIADALGLTFQQVQKYEKEVNRISASRLQYLSQILSWLRDVWGWASQLCTLGGLCVGRGDDGPIEENGAKSERGGEILRLGQKRPLNLPSRLLSTYRRAVSHVRGRMETPGRTRQRLSKQGGLSKRSGIRAGALKAPIFTRNGGTCTAGAACVYSRLCDFSHAGPWYEDTGSAFLVRVPPWVDQSSF